MGKVYVKFSFGNYIVRSDGDRFYGFRVINPSTLISLGTLRTTFREIILDCITQYGVHSFHYDANQTKFERSCRLRNPELPPLGTPSYKCHSLEQGWMM